MELIHTENYKLQLGHNHFVLFVLGGELAHITAVAYDQIQFIHFGTTLRFQFAEHKLEITDLTEEHIARIIKAWSEFKEGQHG